MAEENNPQKPSKNSNSKQDPSAVATSRSSQKSKNEDSETIRQPKRRKNCPKALDQIQESTRADRNFSFTFDTKLAETAQEFTPKFGSFRFLVPTKEQDKQSFQSPTLKDKEEEAVVAEEDEKVKVTDDRELVNSGLRFVDGFNEIE